MGSPPRGGTTLARVEAAEQALRVSLPGPLRQALTIANRFAFECSEEPWELHPVWDPDNPRRTASHLVYENHPEQRWPGMGDDLRVIARHLNTADRLVLRVVDAVARPELLFFDSDSGEVRDANMDVHMLYDLACAYARKVQQAAAGRRRPATERNARGPNPRALLFTSTETACRSSHPLAGCARPRSILSSVHRSPRSVGSATSSSGTR